MTQNQLLDEINEELDGYKTFGSVIDIEFVKRVLSTYKIGDLGNVSDGYHTFNELYEFRKAYNVALFNQWGRYTISKPEDNMDMRMYDVHKSWKHYDGELCFGGGWFIVVAHLPEGQISNHYESRDWDLFKIPEREKATYPFDGHTGQDVINRLLKLY